MSESVVVEAPPAGGHEHGPDCMPRLVADPREDRKPALNDAEATMLKVALRGKDHIVVILEEPVVNEAEEVIAAPVSVMTNLPKGVAYALMGVLALAADAGDEDSADGADGDSASGVSVAAGGSAGEAGVGG